MRSRCGAPRLSNAMSMCLRPRSAAAWRDSASDPHWRWPRKLISVCSPKLALGCREPGRGRVVGAIQLARHDLGQVLPQHAEHGVIHQQGVTPRRHPRPPGAEITRKCHDALVSANRPSQLARLQPARSTSICLISAMAFAGLRPLGQVLVQFMMVRQA